MGFVDKNFKIITVGIPKDKSCSNKTKYPFDSLEVGKAFLVKRKPNEDNYPLREDRYWTVFNVRSNITNYLKREGNEGKKFSCRICGADGMIKKDRDDALNRTHVGCWRIQ